MSIIVTSSWSEAYAPLAEITWEKNKVPYAQRHGYKLLPIKHWNQEHYSPIRLMRLAELMDVVPEGDWFFYSACDAVITKMDRRLEEFIVPDCDFIVVMAHAYIFGDVWFVRSCPAVRDMLTYIGWLRPWHDFDQALFAEYLSKSSFAEYGSKVPMTLPDESYYTTCESLLSKSPVRVRCSRPKEKLVGDNPALWGGRVPMFQFPGGCVGFYPPELAWSPEYFMMHVGGKDLNFRLKFLGDVVNRINNGPPL